MKVLPPDTDQWVYGVASVGAAAAAGIGAFALFGFAVGIETLHHWPMCGSVGISVPASVALLLSCAPAAKAWERLARRKR